MKYLTATDLLIISKLIMQAKIQAADAATFVELFERLNKEYQEALNGIDADSSEPGPEGSEAVRTTD